MSTGRDYEEDRGPKQLSGLDSFYANTNFVLLILFSLCCNGLCLLPLILSAVGLGVCKDPTARSNAKTSLIISIIMVVIGIIIDIIYFVVILPQLQQQLKLPPR